MPHPRTILEGIFKLPPRTSLSGTKAPSRSSHTGSLIGTASETVPSSKILMSCGRPSSDAVREQMISDVPVGAFLSGGIDSTIIVGLMQKLSNRPVKTFAIGFPDPDYDETRYAELAARHLGTEHQSFIVEPKAWETLPELCLQFDEPFADSSALPIITNQT